jgi:MFS family permease
MAGGVVIHGTTDVARIEAPVTVKAYLICVFAAFGGIFFGYDTGWMSGVLAMPYFITQYTGLPKPASSDTAAVTAFHLTAQDQFLTPSILSAGTFFGAIAAGDIADFIDRRLTIIVGCGVFTVVLESWHLVVSLPVLELDSFPQLVRFPSICRQLDETFN